MPKKSRINEYSDWWLTMNERKYWRQRYGSIIMHIVIIFQNETKGND